MTIRRFTLLPQSEQKAVEEPTPVPPPAVALLVAATEPPRYTVSDLDPGGSELR